MVVLRLPARVPRLDFPRRDGGILEEGDACEAKHGVLARFLAESLRAGNP